MVRSDYQFKHGVNVTEHGLAGSPHLGSQAQPRNVTEVTSALRT